MGSHGSKAASAKGEAVAGAPGAAAAGDASPSKTNGQENGHVKINGDVSPKADGEPTPLNGNGSAEPVKEEAKAERGNGDTIEPAPVAEGGEPKPDGPAKETPKKKKKFSFKKSFKLSGISFRKAKKEPGDASAGSSPTEEPGKAEETPAGASGETEQAGTAKEEAAEEKPAAGAAEASAPPLAAEGQPEGAAKRDEGADGPAQEEAKPPQAPPASEIPAEAKAEEVSKPAEAESSPAAAEQKEE